MTNEQKNIICGQCGSHENERIDIKCGKETLKGEPTIKDKIISVENNRFPYWLIVCPRCGTITGIGQRSENGGLTAYKRG